MSPIRRASKRVKLVTAAVLTASLAVGVSANVSIAAEAVVAGPVQTAIGSPVASSTTGGITSVAKTDGKAQGSGLWGFVGDVQTRKIDDTVFSHGIAVNPVDSSLWVTDSAKISYSTNSILCEFGGGRILSGTTCYFGESRILNYPVVDLDWGIGDYQANGTYAVATSGNKGLGKRYADLDAAKIITQLPSGTITGARGVTATPDGSVWVADSDGASGVFPGDRKTIHVLSKDGVQTRALGQTTWDSGTNWTNQNAPESFDWVVSVATRPSGNVLVTNQTPQLLKEYEPAGGFVRNIRLDRPVDSAYPGDDGLRYPYAVATDLATDELLVGYLDQGTGKPVFIERIDPNDCTTEVAGRPEGATVDRCKVKDTIGVANLSLGSKQTNGTYVIQVDPLTRDIYVGQSSGQLSVFASDGTFKGKFSPFGSGTKNGQVTGVRGIAFDEKGLMYVTTSAGASATRVQMFARTPDAITGLTAKYTNSARNSASLSWDALEGGVTEDAQTPVRDYVVEQSTDGGATWSVVDRPASTDNTAVVRGLDSDASYQFRVSAWNEAGNGDTAVTAVNDPVPVVISPDSLPAGKVGKDYSATITATGDGIPVLSISDGAFPDGLVFDSVTGKVTGKPTKAGTFTVTVMAVAGEASESKRYTIVVEPADVVDKQNLTITPATLPKGSVGKAYTATVTAKGTGKPVLSLSGGKLPDGLKFDAKTGKITGKPTKTGSFTFTIKAQAGGKSVTKQYMVVIENAAVGPCMEPRKVPVFSDTPLKHKFYKEIDWMECMKYATGWRMPTGKPEYRPQLNIERQAMAAFIFRMDADKSYRAPKVSPFADVKTTDKFYREIAWMWEKGYATGWAEPSGKPTFRSLEPLSREAMAAFIYRLEAAKHPSAKNYQAPAVSPLADMKKGMKFYREISWMYDEELTTGNKTVTGKEFWPKDQLSRQAMAAFIYRLVTDYRVKN